MVFTTQTERIQNQPAFVLHRRPYKNTSFILEIFTRDYGRLTLVAKGAASQKSRQKGLLQVFQPLEISWVRKSDMGTLTAAESTCPPYTLIDDALYSAMYINEILLKLITKDDPHTQVFDEYSKFLQTASQTQQLEPVLRLFEKNLLQDIGYEINLEYEADTSERIIAENKYEYFPGHGFIQVTDNEKLTLNFAGQHLLNFANNELSDIETLRTAKRIMQMSLRALLGDTELKSREIYKAFLATRSA